MIPNPSLDCSYVVFNFWPKLFEPRCPYKIILIKKACIAVSNVSPSPLICICFCVPSFCHDQTFSSRTAYVDELAVFVF